MQSANYVPGVSGWKLHKESGELEIEGVVRVIGLTGSAPASSSEPLAPLEKIAVANVAHESSARCQADERVATHIGAMQCNITRHFVVVDGVTYVRQDHVDKSSTTAVKLAPEWTVKLKLVNGQYVAAGVGLGIASQFLVSADKYHINCMCRGGPA